MTQANEQARTRQEAANKARMEAEATAKAGHTMREEADRLLSEHRARNLELQNTLKVTTVSITPKRLILRLQAARTAITGLPGLARANVQA